MNSPCTVIQEQIVAGQRLGEAEQAHVLGCTGCSKLAADSLALDGLVAEGLDGAGAVRVPDDFADRVMQNLAPDPTRRWDGVFARRPIELVLANLGVAFAVINLVRFVFSALMPSASLGAVP